ncbi:MAG: hypothetical protein ACP5NX_03460 [Candidatus Bilamarchaeaceae archaeon]
MMADMAFSLSLDRDFYIMMATMVSVMGAVILFMLSRLFSEQSLQQTAKAELAFAASTIFLAGVMVILFGPVEQDFLVPLMKDGVFLPSLTNANVDQATMAAVSDSFNLNNPTLIQVSTAYMGTMIECVKSLRAPMMVINVFSETAGSLYVEIFMSEVASGMAYSGLNERLSNTTNIMFFYTLVFYVMLYVLSFVSATAQTLFIPLGIILRSFPPTRGAGAYVIALALGMYFIFPMAFMLGVAISPSPACVSPGDMPWVPSSCSNADASAAFQAKAWLEGNRNSISSFLDEVDLDFLKNLSGTFCLVPLLAMTVVLSFVLSMTGLLGGNIPEVGRGLVKLI